MGAILAAAPLRQMSTPQGGRMIPMTNCGDWGWISDASGYRYSATDPATGKSWPKMPAYFIEKAQAALIAAGFPSVVSTSCLINAYAPGQHLGVHQDKDEADHTQPIVSFSLGLPARFALGGFTRNEPHQEILLNHGDVFVFGGASRMRFHGVLPIKDGHHPQIGKRRFNLTFRVAK